MTSRAARLSKVLQYRSIQIFKAMELETIGFRTFRRHAISYIEPAILHHWQLEQQAILQRLAQEDGVVVCGDMRADSPGVCFS